jgi:hypothetical protein
MKRSVDEALLNQTRFAADQLRQVANRAAEIGLAESARNFRELANQIEFSRGELDEALAAVRAASKLDSK